MKTSDLIRQATQFPGETAYDAFVNDNSLDIEEEQALQDRGLIPSADTRQAFNKFNPVELPSQLLSVLADQGLDEAVNAVKKVTPIVNHAWTHRTKGSAKGVIAMVRKRVAELEPGPSLPVKDKLRDFFRDNPYPDDSKVHKLAEELQMSPHDLETEIYSLLSDLLKENPTQASMRTAERVYHYLKMQGPHSQEFTIQKPEGSSVWFLGLAGGHGMPSSNHKFPTVEKLLETLAEMVDWDDWDDHAKKTLQHLNHGKPVE